MLIGLIDATGLTQYVLAETPSGKEGVIRVRLERLPDRDVPPAFGHLIKTTASIATRRALSGLA